jgi:outer membrane protein assembly factor BamB
MKKTTTLLLGLISVLFATSVQAQIGQTQAGNYQINETHTGSTSVYGLLPPLKQKWSVNFGQSMSYPLIADGKVFVTVRNPSAYGTQLYALNANDGTTAWSYALGGVYYWSALCYENGRVFAINGDGLLRAFYGSTGEVVWSKQLPGQYSFSSPPTVFQGVVYTGGAGSGGTAYAVSADTGNVLWTAPVANGDNSSPAVTTDGVYVSYSCPNVYKLNPANGSLIWRYNPGCSGGGGKTPAVYNGRLYVRDYNPDYIFDSQTGGIAGSFISKSVPAFSGNTGFFMNGPKYFGSYGTLQARDINTNMLLWSFGGDGSLQSSMLVVNDYVYVGSNSGKLFAVDAATGQQVWSTTAGTSIPYVDEQNSSQPLTGFAAGNGLLVIPTTTKLVAYEADHTPTITWDPQTPARNSYGWNNTPVQISFTAAAHPAGPTTSTPGSPIQFNSEGVNQTQQVTVSDEVGNSATYTSPAVKIDLSAPATTNVVSSAYGPPVGGWYKTGAGITLTATDSLSGVYTTFYSLDGGPTYKGTQIGANGDGSHTLRYWSSDWAGNIESEQSVVVNVDAAAPSTQISAGSGWYPDPTQVSLTATDASSGVANTFYKVDGGPTQTYSGPFTVSGDVSHGVVYWSVDAVGNTEAQHNFTLKMDGSAPVSQLSSSGTNGWNGWTVSPAQVTLSAYDLRSGVAATYYNVDGGATQTYSGAFTLSTSGQHQINFWSIDNVGNTEAQKSSTVKVDIAAPTTQNTLSGPAGENNYFRGAVQVSLSATDDAAGVASTYYQVDSGPNKVYSSPFTVSGDGTHTVRIWSQDMAGNQATADIVSINIDATTPSTQSTLAGTAGPNGWYATAVQVTLTGTDNTSGVACTYYAIDGGVSQPYSVPFTISDTGTHTILYWSSDAAGNTESQQSRIIKVDVSAPTTQAAVSGNSSNGWYQSPVQVTLTAADGASGVANTFYKIDGGTTQTYASPFNVSGGGSHVIDYWSVDTAGNAEAQNSLTVQIDATAPSTQIFPSGTAGGDGWYRSAVQVSLTGSDSQSGIGNTFYTVDGGSTQTYSSTFSVSSDGTHQVSFWSVDSLGNSETHQNATVKIDQVAPTTQNSLSGPAGGNGFYKGAVQVSLTASDSLSGVANRYFRIDNGATQTYTAAFNVSGDGNHTVDYWSVDVAGNIGGVSTVAFKIDATAPLTQASVSGPAGTNGWYLGAVQVTLAGADSLSGVQTTNYKIDGGTLKTYSVPFSITGNGAHVVTFWSVDKATNTEATNSLAVNVDANLPGVTANVSPSSAAKSSNPVTVTVSGHATDNTSGVPMSGNVTFNVVDEYGVAQPSGPVVLQSNGNYSFTLTLPATKNVGDNNHLYTVFVRGTDRAGNSSTASDTLKIN